MQSPQTHLDLSRVQHTAVSKTPFQLSQNDTKANVTTAYTAKAYFGCRIVPAEQKWFLAA